MRKKALYAVFILVSCMLLSGCGITDWVSAKLMDPEEVFAEAKEAMLEMETVKQDGKTVLEGNILGASFEFNVSTKTQSRYENGVPVQTYMETTMNCSGIPETTERIYFSETEFGTYNNQNSSWEISKFNGEDQFFVNLFMSSLDPTSAFNNYANSKVEQKLEVVGKETVNGVKCIGISVETNADQLTKDLSPVLKTFAGSAGGFATSLAGEMVKNIEQVYWIGEDDRLIHGMDMLLNTFLGNYQSDVIFYGHNEAFSLPE